LLQGVSGHLLVLRLLNRVNRAVILVDWSGLRDLGLLLAHSLFAIVKANPFFLVFVAEILVVVSFILLVSGNSRHRLILARLR